MEFVIANIIMGICTAAMVLYGLTVVCVNNEDDKVKKSKKSKIGDFIACFIMLILGFFLLFNYVTIEINDKIKELKEELNTEITTTTETTTIPTTITDDDGNIYVLQTTSAED